MKLARKSLIWNFVQNSQGPMNSLTHWGRVTHICVSQLTIIGSDNGLSPDRHQVIIWTNDGILLFGLLERNFSEILIEIYTFSFLKKHLKMLSGKWRPSCLGLNLSKGRRCVLQEFYSPVQSDHYSDITWGVLSSQITDHLTVCSTVCSDKRQRKLQSSALNWYCWIPHTKGK